MATTRLLKTLGTPTNGKKFTWSAWVKRAKLGGDQVFFNANNAGSVNVTFRFNSNNKLYFFYLNSGSMIWQYETSAVYRDSNAWMHIVFAYDSTLGTNSDRIKIYVNGTRVTNFDAATHASQDVTNSMNSAVAHYIGDNGGGNQFDGCMSHIHFTDGYTYQASSFGSTDATTGEWQLNASPSVTYGNNGFFILKDSNSLTDQSPNTNNWAVDTGTLTSTKDNPSNNFATVNPLQSFSSGSLDIDFANTRVRGNGSAWMRANAGLAAKSGKWYYEAYIQATTSGRPIRLGWDSADNPRNGADTYYSGFNISTDGYIRGGVNGYSGYDPNATALGVTFTTGDYIGLAIDIDGDTVTAYKNGTVISNVNALSLSGFTNCSIKKSRGHWITPSVVFYSVSNNDNRTEFNFGNGAFANTQLTGTTYTDSAGFGVFKYQPPTNYLAWCTKNLNQ